MKRKWIIGFIAVTMLFGGATVATADFRMDIDIPWWLHLGLSDELENQLGAEFDTVDISEFLVIVPNLQAYYMFHTDLVDIGVGARIYTVLLANFLYPSAMAELHLGRFDVNLNVGGLAGLFVAIGPTVETFTGPWISMDLSAGYRVTDWFRVGLGAFAVAHTDFIDAFPYAVYLSGKFILGPGK